MTSELGNLEVWRTVGSSSSMAHSLADCVFDAHEPRSAEEQPDANMTQEVACCNVGPMATSSIVPV